MTEHYIDGGGNIPVRSWARRKERDMAIPIQDLFERLRLLVIQHGTKEDVDALRGARPRRSLEMMRGRNMDEPTLAETVARIVCRHDVPYNWQGRNRDAWVEIQWKAYIPVANAILADPSLRAALSQS